MQLQEKIKRIGIPAWLMLNEKERPDVLYRHKHVLYIDALDNGTYRVVVTSGRSYIATHGGQLIICSLDTGI